MQRNERCGRCKRIALWKFKDRYFCGNHRPANAKFVPKHKCMSKNCHSITETNPFKNVTGLYCDPHDVTPQKMTLPKCNIVDCDNTAIFRFIGKLPTRCAIHNVKWQVPIGRIYCEVDDCMEYAEDGSTKCIKHLQQRVDPDNITVDVPKIDDEFRKMIHDAVRVAPKKRCRSRKKPISRENDDPEYVESEDQSDFEDDESDFEDDDPDFEDDDPDFEDNTSEKDKTFKPKNKKDKTFKPKNKRNKRNKRQRTDKFEIVDLHPKDTDEIITVVNSYKTQVITYQNEVLDFHNKMITLRNENTVLRQELSTLSETLTALIRFVNENIHKK